MISVTVAFIYFSPQYGNTALHLASRNGHPEVVKLLLQSHADVNVKNNVSTESPHYSILIPCYVNPEILILLLVHCQGSEN